MSITLCDYYYTFCLEDCPDDDMCRCPFFAAEYEEYHQYTIWELI